MWSLLARLIAWPPIADWLILRSWRTPYSDITSADGTDTYMKRWWLFNPYYDNDPRLRSFKWLPLSIRVHHIQREDQDRDLHDHPWNARTVILLGEYTEVREDGQTYRRKRGDTAALKHNEYHRIIHVDPQWGAMTLFITYRYRGTWGFKVDGKKVPWREYLGL